MKNKLDCRRKENRNSLKCGVKKIHNNVCKSRSSEGGTITKGIISLASPQIALAVVATDIGKFVYKKSFC